MSYIEWLRQQIGPQKTILIYSTVVIRDTAGSILMQRRSDFDWWGLPGGILERGEDIVHCARREVCEETGLEVSSLRLVGLYTHPRYDVVYPNGDEIQQFTVCFTARALSGLMRPDGVETLALAFFAPDTIAGLAVPAWYQAMIADTLHAGPPAFEWEPPDVGALTVPAGNTGLWREPASIMPAAVAVLQRDDGRVYRPVDGTGHGHFPWRPMSVGETAAATAVRAAGNLAAGAPSRLLGIASRPGMLGSTNGYTDHVVAAIFLLVTAPGAPQLGSGTDWISLHELAAEAAAPDLDRLIGCALAGRAVVDDQVEETSV